MGLREVISEHSGKNMAAVLLDIFKDYRIRGNIRYFIANNAELNNTCINIILQVLYPGMLVKKRKACRLRCFSYIINLYAQAFIVGVDAENICKDLAAVYWDQDFKKIELL